MALWPCFAVGLAMYALESGSRAQTAAIVAFQITPAALVAPLRLLRKPRLGPRAADGCTAVHFVLHKATCSSIQHTRALMIACIAGSEASRSRVSTS